MILSFHYYMGVIKHFNIELNKHFTICLMDKLCKKIKTTI